MDAQELGELYSRVGPVIYRRCLRLLGDRELAREATQEVFVRATRHAERLDPGDRECLPWLYRVATNYCLNALRDRPTEALGRSFETWLRDASPSAEARLLTNERIADLFRTLDERTAQIAFHSFVDEMTQDEIAQIMGLSRRTVGTHLRGFLAAAQTSKGAP
ncbi:MAG: sigma-70 family RNA polymerase sigma factor [Myxococcota bacterium]|jgi:RNA polymerase sigma-70 factor (ECF subfamily)|nr:sigma-70 family RNA polymerase sigma factor [Myxococcota bacterium]